MIKQKVYILYDQDKYVGSFNINEICRIIGSSKKYAYRICGESICYKGRYTMSKVEKITECVHEGLPAEWERTTALLREVIGVEKRIRDVWDETVRPFRRRNNSIWRS